MDSIGRYNSNMKKTIKKTENRGGRRVGAGRPSVYGPAVQLSVLLPEDLLKTLKKVAKREKTTANRLMVGLLKSSLRANCASFL